MPKTTEEQKRKRAEAVKAMEQVNRRIKKVGITKTKTAKKPAQKTKKKSKLRRLMDILTGAKSLRDKSIKAGTRRSDALTEKEASKFFKKDKKNKKK